MKTKVCIIGHFGADIAIRDGQTVKTRMLEQALRIYGTDELDIRKVDTYYLRHNFLKFLFQLMAGVFACQRIILCVSRGGRKVFFPMLYVLVQVFGKKTYHCAIGGRLADEVRNDETWRRYVNS